MVSNFTLFLYSPVPCDQLQVIDALSIVLLILTILVNALLLFTINKSKCLHTPINYLITCLAVNNLVGIISQSVLTIPNLFNCRFIYGKIGCSSLAFGFYFSIIMSSYLVTFISYERYMLVCNNKTITIRQYLISMAVSITVCILLSSGPLFGWSEFSYELDNINCFSQPNQNNWITLTYTVCVVLFPFSIPAVILLKTNYEVIQTVKKSRQKFISNISERKRTEREKNVAKATVSLVGTFFIAYAIFFISRGINLFSPSVIINMPIITTITFLIARFGFFWSSLVYMLTNEDIRSNLFRYKTNRVTPLNTFMITTTSTKRNKNI